MAKKILIFKTGALGDILMTTPLVRQIRKNYPTSQISYLVGNSFKQVIEDNININKIITFDEKIFFNKKLFKFIKLINKIKKNKYDIIFVLDKHWVFSFTAFLFGIPKRVGFYRDTLSKLFLTDHIRYKKVRHEINYYLDLLNILDKKSDYADNKLDFYLNKDEIKKINYFIKKNKLKEYFVFINSGGDNAGESSQIRRLPENIFKKMLEKLSRKNQVILLGSEKEKNYYEKFLLNNNIINFAFSIKESIAFMKFAKRIYTTDCGGMHMAATVNDNITAFFGPTNPERKAPFVKKLQVIWADQDIYEDKYELYGKIPKNKKYFEKIKDKKLQ